MNCVAAGVVLGMEQTDIERRNGNSDHSISQTRAHESTQSVSGLLKHTMPLGFVSPGKPSNFIVACVDSAYPDLYFPVAKVNAAALGYSDLDKVLSRTKYRVDADGRLKTEERVRKWQSYAGLFVKDGPP